MFERLSQIEFRKLVWILPVVWAFHEAEEWNILAWYERFWVNIPEMTPITVWTWLGFISLCGFVWTLIATRFSNQKVTAFFIMPFFTFFAFANALQHVYFLFYFKTYNPGLVTAALLIIPAMLLITCKAYKEKLIPLWYAVLVYFPIVPAMLTVIKAGNEVPEIMHKIYGFSAGLAELIWGTY